jgi:hypothetical protein
MSGNSSMKTTVMVSTLPCADTSAPTVSVTAPVNGSTASGTITGSVNATDNVGVTKVEFYSGSTLLGTDTSAPYTYAWSTATTPIGKYKITGTAYDAAGNKKTSTAITVTVTK